MRDGTAEHVDKTAARSLTLVAKTLQNLANLVPFGQKEPFMADMNDLINSRIPDMKRFIIEASVRTTPCEPVPASSSCLPNPCAPCATVTRPRHRTRASRAGPARPT